jgi:NDMA-dependent alcohol dehydrogenase
MSTETLPQTEPLATRAAVLWDRHVPWKVEQIELDPPKETEVLVELVASGICHSDEHTVTGDMPFLVPVIGGHEGAGIVRQVGAHVSWLQPGDHVVFGFIPSCGRCPACSTGHQNLCDLGAVMFRGRQIADGTARHHLGGEDLAISCMIGAFAERTVVNEASCIKIDPEYPLELACLLGCGFVTGWGSAVYAGGVRPGDAVVVAGVGGIGGAAIQGAKLAGAKVIVAIEPVEAKAEVARKLGATHVASSWETAPEVVAEATWQRGANVFICAMGVGDGSLINAALAMTAKQGRVVVTNIHPAAEVTASISFTGLTLSEKQIVGTVYGSANPRFDIPNMMELWTQGLVDLESMITERYRLDDINDGFEALRAGQNLRGVIVH